MHTLEFLACPLQGELQILWGWEAPFSGFWRFCETY